MESPGEAGTSERRRSTGGRGRRRGGVDDGRHTSTADAGPATGVVCPAATTAVRPIPGLRRGRAAAEPPRPVSRGDLPSPLRTDATRHRVPALASDPGREWCAVSSRRGERDLGIGPLVQFFLCPTAEAFTFRERSRLMSISWLYRGSERTERPRRRAARLMLEHWRIASCYQRLRSSTAYPLAQLMPA